MTKVVHISAGDPLQASVEELKRRLPLFAEHLALVAQYKRAYYLSLTREGFTKEEALELCKLPAEL